MFKVLPPLSSTLGRSERESMEMAESVRTAVTPRVTRSEVASLFSQNPTQDSTTISAQGRYTWTVTFLVFSHNFDIDIRCWSPE